MLQHITRQIIVAETGMPEAYSRNEDEAFFQIINSFHLLTFFAKRSTLDALQYAKYASKYYIALRKLNILQK